MSIVITPEELEVIQSIDYDAKGAGQYLNMEGQDKHSLIFFMGELGEPEVVRNCGPEALYPAYYVKAGRLSVSLYNGWCWVS